MGERKGHLGSHIGRNNRINGLNNVYINDTTGMFDISGNFVKETKIVAAKTLESNGHKKKIYAADFGDKKYERRLVSGGKDNQLIIWDFDKGSAVNEITLSANNKKTSKFPWVSSLCWQNSSDMNIAVGFIDGSVSIYPVESQLLEDVATPVYKKKTHFGVINSTKFLANNEDKLITAGVDWCIKVQDINQISNTQTLFGHNDIITDLAVHEEEPNLIVSSSLDKTCRVWDLRTGKEAGVFDQNDSGLNCVVFSPNGNSFAAGFEEGCCKLFDYRNFGHERSVYFAHEDKLPGPVDNICFTANGGMIVASHGSNLVACNAMGVDEFGTEKFDYLEIDKAKGHQDQITALVGHSKGRRFLSASFDKKVIIWKVQNKKLRKVASD